MAADSPHPNSAAKVPGGPSKAEAHVARAEGTNPKVDANKVDAKPEADNPKPGTGIPKGDPRAAAIDEVVLPVKDIPLVHEGGATPSSLAPSGFDAEAAVRERYPERVGEVKATVELRDLTPEEQEGDDGGDDEGDPGGDPPGRARPKSLDRTDPANLVVTYHDAQGRFLASEPYRRPGSARTGNG